MVPMSVDKAGWAPAATCDYLGKVPRDEPWRSLRTVLDTGGPWVLVDPSGAIRAIGVRFDDVVDRICENSLVLLVGPQEGSTVLRAIEATARGEGPIRLLLRPAFVLDASITVTEMVFTRMPIDRADGGSVIVQLVEATTWGGEIASCDDRSSQAELESALRRIHDLILQFRSHTGLVEDDLPTIAEPLPESLSKRRRQVATAVLSGKTVKDIADAFDLSPHTIRNHLKVVYRQLGVNSRAELQRRFHP